MSGVKLSIGKIKTKVKFLRCEKLIKGARLRSRSRVIFYRGIVDFLASRFGKASPLSEKVRPKRCVYGFKPAF
jgi:hypothetical protein